MRSFRSRILLVAWIPCALHLAGVRAEASDPKVMTIVREMKKVFEPDRPSIRKIDISVSTGTGLDVNWEARKAARTLPEGKRTLIVLLEPPDVRGNAFLVQEGKGGTDVEWVYVPFVRRVRKIVPVTEYERFLDTDFTYADLGFVSYDGSYELLGEEERAGEAAYKLAFTPTNPWFYSRVVTWVSKGTHLPLERDYYDVRGQLWKRETFEQVTVISGIPTPLRIEMKDVQNEMKSVFAVSEVRFDPEIPEDLFSPAMLPKAADSSFWKQLETAGTSSRDAM